MLHTWASVPPPPASLAPTCFPHAYLQLKIQLISFGLVIVQFCALSWYHLSYVPYGQQCVKRLIQRMM